MRKLFHAAKKRIFKPGEYAVYKQLETNQNVSYDQLCVLNLNKRLELARYAFEHVPLYRAKYTSSGVSSPEDICSEEDFCRLPIVTKDDLRERNEQFFSDCASRSFGRESTTGGSTGVPVRVFHDQRVFVGASKWRMLNWWHISPNANQATVWRSLPSQRSVTLGARIRQWPAKKIFLNASDMSEDDLCAFVRQFNMIRPKILQGYVGAIEHLARFVEENKIKISSPSIVWVTSAPVSKTQRALMERIFRAPVVDQYGCCEMYWLAAECPHSNGALHFFYDIRHIEFVDDTNDEVSRGAYGRVLLTDLQNYLFPLIRYENGDRGRWMLEQRCACGNSLPLIDSIKGRVTDSITLPNGKFMATLATVFDDFPDAVSQFQVCFKASKDLILRVVQNDKNADSGSQIQEVQKRLEAIADGSATVVLERVHEIPHDRGKTRYVICEN